MLFPYVAALLVSSALPGLVVGPETLLEPRAVGSVSMPTDERQPAIAWSARRNELLVVWVDGRRLTQTDLFAARVKDDGTLIDQQGFPLYLGAGDQRRPTVTAAGDHWVVAWENVFTDGGTEVMGLELTDPQQLGVPVRAGLGTAPSLAGLDDGTVYLSYAQAGLSPIVVKRPAGSATSTQIFAAMSPGDRVTRTELRVVPNEPISLGVEAELNGRSHVSLYRAPTAAPLFTTASGASLLLAQVGPAVMVGPEAGDVWFAWQTALAGVEGRAFRADGGVESFSRPNTAGPALASVAGAPRLFVTASPSAFEVHDPLGMTKQSFLAPNFATSEMVVAVHEPAFTFAFTDGMLNRDVHTLTSTSPGVLRDPATAPRLQRDARVVLRGDEGLAVWREGVELVRAARLRVREGGVLEVRNAFTVATASNGTSLNALDVALGEGLALVAWREDGVGPFMFPLRVALVQGESVGAPVLLTSSGGSTPDNSLHVAWDGTQFAVLAVEGGAVSLQRVSTTGVVSAPQLQQLASVPKGADLSCVAGTCVAVWQLGRQISARVFGAQAPTTPMVLEVTADGELPAVAHDGTSFHFAWRGGTGIETARLEGAAVVRDTNLPVNVLVPVGSVAMADATPPVIAWSAPGAVVTDLPQTWLGRLGSPPQSVGSGQNVDVATTAVGRDVRGVVVAQQYESAVTSVQTHATAFEWTLDAGVDGGMGDGGVDAGAEAVDAGSPPVTFTSSGCAGCSQGVDPGWGLVVLLWRRRQRSGSSSVWKMA